MEFLDQWILLFKADWGNNSTAQVVLQGIHCQLCTSAPATPHTVNKIMVPLCKEEGLFIVFSHTSSALFVLFEKIHRGRQKGTLNENTCHDIQLG